MPLIGRNSEIAEARSLLMRSGVRLLTLIGVAGSGKTRLAIAVAQEVAAYYLCGAVLVDLSPACEPSPVLAAIAQALGLREQSTAVHG